MWHCVKRHNWNYLRMSIQIKRMCSFDVIPLLNHYITTRATYQKEQIMILWSIWSFKIRFKDYKNGNIHIIFLFIKSLLKRNSKWDISSHHSSSNAKYDIKHLIAFVHFRVHFSVCNVHENYQMQTLNILFEHQYMVCSTLAITIIQNVGWSKIFCVFKYNLKYFNNKWRSFKPTSIFPAW